MAPRHPSWTAATLLAFALAFTAGVGSVFAQPVRPVNEVLMVCAGCHNPEPGTLAPIDAHRIPRLGGQQAEYLRAALEAYRTRQRDHFYMRGMAAGLRGAELEAALRHLSMQEDAGSGSMAPAGNMPAAAARCIACHGSASQPPATPQTPRLAGQHAPYIESAFLAYARGARSHPVMGAQAKGADGTPSLSAEELRDVAGWFSAQGGLVPR